VRLPAAAAPVVVDVAHVVLMAAALVRHRFLPATGSHLSMTLVIPERTMPVQVQDLTLEHVQVQV